MCTITGDLLITPLKHSWVTHIAQQFAMSSRWHQVQSTLLIRQVTIPSWQQLKSKHVPRPFLPVRGVWFRDYPFW